MGINQESFDSRVLRFGALGLCALLLAAFIRLAVPVTGSAGAAAKVYDVPATSWPRS